MKNGRLWVQEWLNLRKLRTFAKNTAHNERRLLNYVYLCIKVHYYDSTISYSSVVEAQIRQ